MDQEEFIRRLQIPKKERQEGINEAKAALFAYLARHPLVARITACYSGYGDEGCIEEIRYFNAEGESIEVKDGTLYDLVDDLFYYVTPEGFWNDDGGDGKIHVYPVAQKVVVEHKRYFVDYESETYEA